MARFEFDNRVPVMPNVIGNPRVQRKLQDAFDLKGSPSPAPTVGTEIQPVVLVSDLTAPDETDLSFERTAIGRVNAGPTALRYSHLQIFNPVGSNIIVSVDAVLLYSTANDVVLGGFYDTALTGAPAATFRSFRNRRLPGEPIAQVRSEDALAQVGEYVLRFSILANEVLYLPLDVIFPSGTGFVFVRDTVNAAFDSSWWWTERNE